MHPNVSNVSTPLITGIKMGINRTTSNRWIVTLRGLSSTEKKRDQLTRYRTLVVSRGSAEPFCKEPRKKGLSHEFDVLLGIDRI